jgi:hypothetical protein
MDVHLIPDNYGTRRHPKNRRIRLRTFFSVEELDRAIEEYLEEKQQAAKTIHLDGHSPGDLGECPSL